MLACNPADNSGAVHVRPGNRDSDCAGRLSEYARSLKVISASVSTHSLVVQKRLHIAEIIARFCLNRMKPDL